LSSLPAISLSRPAELTLWEAQMLVYTKNAHHYIRHSHRTASKTVSSWVYETRTVVEEMCRIVCLLWRNGGAINSWNRQQHT
jgi:hypothetical protein